MISAILANFASAAAANASTLMQMQVRCLSKKRNTALCTGIVLSTSTQSKQQRGTEVKQIYGNETVVK